MNFKKFAIQYLPIILIALLIISFAVINAASTLSSPDFAHSGETVEMFILKTVIKTLPTLITLVVLLLQANAKRIAFLLGAANSALYGFSYILLGLYFSAISAFLISVPIQTFTFFSWKKNSTGNKVKFKRMKPWQLAATVGIILAGWAVCHFLLSPYFKNGSFPLLDALTFSIGTVVTIIIAFRFIEAPYFNAVSCIIALIIHILLTLKDPMNINYVIISFYNLFRVVQAAVNWTKQYLNQRSDYSDASVNTDN